MTITFLIGNLSNSGGTQRMLTLLCNELIDNFEITVLLNKEGESFFPLDKRVQIEVLKGNLLQKNIQIYKSLKKTKSKYYINLDSNSVLLNGFLLPRKTKLIIWEHYSLENNFRSLLFTFSRYYAKFKASKFVLLSAIEKELWHQKYGVSKNKAEIIYNPTTIQPENIKQSNRYMNKQVLAIGNQIDFKGFDILLKAWKKVERDWSLQIVGLKVKQIEKLERLKKQLNLENVELLGNTNSIQDHYKKSSIYVLSSRMEATPLVLVEAQTIGLPIVAFDHLSGVKEIMKDSILYADFEQEENDLAIQIKSLIDQEILYNEFREKSILNSKRFSTQNFITNWGKILTSNL